MSCLCLQRGAYYYAMVSAVLQDSLWERSAWASSRQCAVRGTCRTDGPPRLCHYNSQVQKGNERPWRMESCVKNMSSRMWTSYLKYTSLQGQMEGLIRWSVCRTVFLSASFHFPTVCIFFCFWVCFHFPPLITPKKHTCCATLGLLETINWRSALRSSLDDDGGGGGDCDDDNLNQNTLPQSCR